MSGESTCQQSRGHSDCTTVAKSKLVHETSQASGGATNCHPSQEESVSAAGNKTARPTTRESNTVGMSLVRKLYEERGFSEKTTDIIMLSWRDSRKQYDVHMRRWLLFCGTREIDPVHAADIKDALEFLADVFGNSLSYSSINSARSALSAILQTSQNHTFGEHPDVKRVMKGIYQIRPPMPRYMYNKTWDVNIVLQYLQSMDRATELSLKDLTLKLVMLTALTTAGREQTLHLLNFEGMVKDDSCIVFVISSNVKQSRLTNSLTERFC